MSLSDHDNGEEGSSSITAGENSGTGGSMNGAARKQVQIVGAPPPHYGSGRKDEQNGLGSEGEDDEKEEEEDAEDMPSDGEEIDDAKLLDAFPDDAEVR